MTVELAVCDPLPVFRYGLLCALGVGGVDLATVEEARVWLAGRTAGVLLLTLNNDAALALLDQLRGRQTSVSVVVVIPTASEIEVANVLRAGAVNYVPREAPTSRFREVVDETLRGSVTLTIAALHAAVAPPHLRTSALNGPSDVEVGWLRQLAAGSTVAALSEAAGYSERMMFRKLRDLYWRLGVDSKTGALMLAQNAGWL